MDKLEMQEKFSLSLTKTKSNIYWYHYREDIIHSKL